MNKQPEPVEPESSNDDVAHELHWVPFAVPLAVAMIFAMAGLICLWLDLLI